MILKNNRGLTVVEILIALGIASFAMVLIAGTQLSMFKDQTRMRKQLEANIDETLAERLLFKDFNGLDPSYNNLNVKDDSGKSFFDFYPDIPEKLLEGKKDREITLRLGGVQEFYVLAQDVSAGSLMIYDPVMAYEVGPAPDNFNIAASLNFQSLNRNNWVKAQRPGFWVDGKLLMLDTPARVRPVKSGAVDFQFAPRSPIFVGQVQANGLKPLAVGVSKFLINTHPETEKVIDSVDTFLRNVPSIGGGQPVVRLRAVKLVKYHLEKDALKGGFKTQTANLYRSIYKNGEFAEKTLLADKVDEFSLRRDSVMKRMIYYKVQKAESL